MLQNILQTIVFKVVVLEMKEKGKITENVPKGWHRTFSLFRDYKNS